MRLVSLGALGPEDRVELLEGLMVQKGSPNLPHIIGVRAIAAALRAVYGQGFDVSQPLPVGTPESVPEPLLDIVEGLAIGFTIVFAAIAGGPISGGVFNPAVGIGATVLHAIEGGGTWSNVWIPVVAPLFGSAIGSFVWRFQEMAPEP